MYTSKDIAMVVPTKDRPERIRQLLGTLSAQSTTIGRLIIVDGADREELKVESVVNEFLAKPGFPFPIQYTTCQPPGQIRQRVKGLSLVDTSFPLIAFFDDDIVLEPGAMQTMIDFWNQAPKDTGGVAFNLVNLQPHQYSKARALIGMSGQPGQVLPSGYNISVVHQERDIRTQWLPGGCTVWRQKVVREFPQIELNTSWAAGEDVRFSYPIGKKYPLFVCAAAKAHDTGQATGVPAPKRARFMGRRESLAYLYLVELNRDLSYWRCTAMIAISAGILFLKGLTDPKRSIHRAYGHILALIDLTIAKLSGRTLKHALED